MAVAYLVPPHCMLFVHRRVIFAEGQWKLLCKHYHVNVASSYIRTCFNELSISTAVYDNLSCIFLTIYRLINTRIIIVRLLNVDFGEAKFV